MFNRLFQPIDNIYYASGGLKDYDIQESIKKEFLSKIANIRDNKTLSEWVQQNAVQLFNTDPNGLIFIEYKDQEAYPTYKSIDAIRYYKSKGQIVDYVVFEPYVKETKTYWRIVDDSKDRLFLQSGNEFSLVEERTFDNPFGQVPALICSNINIIGQKNKLAAIDGILDDAKEKGYIAGVKFVRGAYMEAERARAAALGYPDPICKDKQATDENFDEAVRFTMDHLDCFEMFMGTHNEESNYKLAKLIDEKGLKRDDPRIFFAQLLGMSDNISFNLAHEGYNVTKYVPYAKVRDVLPYLIRRAEENTSVAGQTSRELRMLKAELDRRKAVRAF